MSVNSFWHEASGFKLYSFGIAAENKPLTTKTLLVIPIEVLPAMEGELGEESEELKHKGVNSFDEPYEVTVKTRNAIPCKWLQWGSNRDTAPDVRRGERILIFRVGDSDEEFYWVSMGLDDYLRRLETVRYLFNADPDGLSDSEPSPENSYCLEYSTHEKKITLTTTKLNGEPFAYTVQLNTGEGYFTVTDDAKTFIEMDSAEQRITLHNTTGTFLECNKEDIIGYAVRDANFTAVRNITFKCENFTVEANNTYSVKSQKASIKAPGGIELDGPVHCKNTLKVDQKTTAMGIESTLPIKGPSMTI